MLRQHGLRLARWLTEPAPSIVDPVVRGRARFLAVTILILIPLGLCMTVLPLFTEQDLSTLDDVDFHVVVIGVVFWVAAFLLGRRGYVDQATLLTVATASTVAFIAAVLDDEPHDVVYLIMPVLFSSIMLPWPRTLVIALINGIAVLSLPLFVEYATITDLLVGEFSVYAFGSILILILNRYLDRLQAERQALATQNAERLRAILEGMPIMLSAMDSTGHISVWNHECERVTGYSAGEVIGSDAALDALFPGGADRVQMWSAQPDRQGQWDWPLRCKDGTERTIAWTAVPAHADIGEQVVWGVGMDITDRISAQSRRFELALERERSSILRSILDSMSHDLRTPLATLKSGLFLLKRAEDLSRRDRFVVVAEEQLARLEKIVNDMLTVLSQESNEPGRVTLTKVDLNELVRMAYDTYYLRAQEKRQRFEFVPGKDVKRVWADATTLRTAIGNLIENAVNFAPDESRITITTQRLDGWYSVEIADTGPGIPDTDLPHIFEHFYRGDVARSTSTGGAGLGLPIARHIIQLHGGSIEVNSAPGEGTTFRVVLPTQIPTPGSIQQDSNGHKEPPPRLN